MLGWETATLGDTGQSMAKTCPREGGTSQGGSEPTLLASAQVPSHHWTSLSKHKFKDKMKSLFFFF